VFQTIINQFPPHRVYIEPFVGGGNVFERKAPAASSVLADLDRAVVETWRRNCAGRAGVEVLHANALDLLSSYPWVGDELVYLDPPYVLETRKPGGQELYRFEMSEADHQRLLELAASIPAMVAISGYRCALYDDASSRYGWRRVDFKAMTRRGLRTESLWMNYPAPAALADYGYAGSNFRERERIKRKAARWVRRWEQLPAIERGAILSAMRDRGIIGADGGAVPASTSAGAGDGVPPAEAARAPGDTGGDGGARSPEASSLQALLL
jgi:hypothetical protein